MLLNTKAIKVAIVAAMINAAPVLSYGTEPGSLTLTDLPRDVIREIFQHLNLESEVCLKITCKQMLAIYNAGFCKPTSVDDLCNKLANSHTSLKRLDLSLLESREETEQALFKIFERKRAPEVQTLFLYFAPSSSFFIKANNLEKLYVTIGASIVNIRADTGKLKDITLGDASYQKYSNQNRPRTTDKLKGKSLQSWITLAEPFPHLETLTIVSRQKAYDAAAAGKNQFHLEMGSCFSKKGWLKIADPAERQKDTPFPKLKHFKATIQSSNEQLPAHIEPSGRDGSDSWGCYDLNAKMPHLETITLLAPKTSSDNLRFVTSCMPEGLKKIVLDSNFWIIASHGRPPRLLNTAEQSELEQKLEIVGTHRSNLKANPSTLD